MKKDTVIHVESNNEDNATGDKDTLPALPQQKTVSPKTNSKKDSRPSPKKSVSFSHRPPQVKEFESSAEEFESSADDADEDGSPWYSEHQEALIMLAVAGFSAVSLMALRRSFR